jgi:hypothetical protein
MNKTKSQVTTDIFGETSTLEFSETKHFYPDKQKHTIVSLFGAPDPEELNFNGIACRPEPSIKREDPVNDKLWRKYNKAEKILQMELMKEAVRKGLMEEEVLQDLTFSRKAGCSCGCSPGWVKRDYKRRSLFLTLVVPSKQKKLDESRKEYLSQQEERTMASMVI